MLAAMKRSVWIVIICGGLIMTLAMGLRQSLGLFLKPISIDLGLGREVFALAIGIQNLLWGFASPFAGVLADRYGALRVAVVGGLLYVGGLMLMAISVGPDRMMLGSFLIGIGLSGCTFATVLGAVGRAAPLEKRSLALGLAAAGGSFGQFAVVPIGHGLLDAYGWSSALLLLGFMGLAMVPLSIGLGSGGAPKRVPGAQTVVEALREAMRHKSFWLLTAGFFVCGFQVVFVGTHLPAYLADQAMPTWLGAWSLALVGLFNIIGTYTAGILGGKHSKKMLLAFLYLARAGVFFLFIILPKSEASVLMFAGALGLLWLSTVPLTSGLVAHFFGPTYMSMLYGIVFLSHQVGSFLGAWLGGYAYDLTGSYDLMWWLSVALGVAAAALHWPIVERPVARLAPALTPAQ